MDNIRKKIYWVWFSLVQLGSIKKQKLLSIFGTPEKIYNATEKELLSIKGLGVKSVSEILDISIRKKLEKHLGYLENNDISIITIQDKEYSYMLRQIYDYPISLYVRGNVELLKSKSISIVGCREPSKYGINCAKYFGFNLANNGICIVSGLARGIDSYAHIGAITAKNGKTIAVLGNGLDTMYPKENMKLAKKILDLGGAIISEYPLGMPPNRANFPGRNRIVSGLSTGVLVIEAKEKSGTLITVDFALEQGRDVYVVPGNINSINSVGTNKLIKEGAILVNNYKDLL